MDLRANYLGLELANPLVLGASPLAQDVDSVVRCVEAGAAAVTMHSLFEEQLTQEELAHERETKHLADSFAEAQSWVPTPPEFALGPDDYLEQIRRIKSRVDVPVIGSLNGVSARGWLRYARLIQEAGADALELNVYQLAADPEQTAESIEARILEMVASVRSNVDIPLAVKLSPFHTSLVHFAKRLTAAGVAGLVVFNRFYHPDIDIEELENLSRLKLSDPSELLLRLRWLAILFGTAKDLAVTGGVHEPADAIKAVMAGANAVQMVSAVLKNGAPHFRTVLDGMKRWLEEHDYESVQQMHGSMSLLRCPDPRAYERANYVQILQNWQSLGLTALSFARH